MHDVLLNEVADLVDIGRVSCVRQSEFQVMRTSLEHSDRDVCVAWDVVEESTGSPGVKVAIGEHNVGGVEEVLAGVSAAEGVEGPVELRVQVALLLAALDEGVGAPKVGEEHVGDSICLDGHDHLVADLVAPAVVVEIVGGG